MNTKITVVVIAVIIVILAALLFFVKQRLPAPATVIHMKADSYEPSTTTIKQGTAVIFVNESAETRWPASNIHPTHEILPEFDAKREVAPSESWQFRFNKKGTWYFHDHIKPSITGVIVVE